MRSQFKGADKARGLTVCTGLNAVALDLSSSAHNTCLVNAVPGVGFALSFV